MNDMASAPVTTQNITGRWQQAGHTEQPARLWQVIRLVRRARQRGTHLYPYSTGLNFGYGGKSPVVGDAILVDLSRMNRIRNAGQISLANPVAVIEPGVTQQQLYEFLEQHCPELTFNVTGSARHTSILGNALDRGVGYFGPRKEDVFGLEVVCGNGKLISTGFRRLGDDSPLAHSHPYGLGPILDGLFFQGNFGIVTSACFRLVPKRPCQVALSLALHSEHHLPAFIDQLAGLKREGLLESVTHIGNQARTHATLTYGITTYLENECKLPREQALAEAERAVKLVAPAEWASLGAVTGTKAQVKANLAEIRRRMKPLASVRVITDGRLDFAYALTNKLRFIPFMRANAAAISAIRPLHVLALGQPTDAAIDNLLWKYGRTDLPAVQLDASDCGLLFVNPALPLDGQFVARVIDKMKRTAATFRHPLYITVNIETATSLVAVINLLFNRRNEEEVTRAHACAAALHADIRSEGLEVYRARADMMADVVTPDSAYWQTVAGLKRTLDPDDIIAPGRYNLTPLPAAD
ncbi:MAG: FAD-binding protein [Pseudomonadota bacterium]